MSLTPEQIALDRIRQAAETKAEELDLSKLGLTSLPDELWDLAHLKELQLGDNKINALPPDIKKLTNLASLYLTRNKFATLPKEVWELPLLKEIFLSGNPFSRIPAEIWQRNNWEGLGLGKLCTNGLPSELFKLKQLTLVSAKATQPKGLRKRFLLFVPSNLWANGQ